jgi:hypothetical protein
MVRAISEFRKKGKRLHKTLLFEKWEGISFLVNQGLWDLISAWWLRNFMQETRESNVLSADDGGGFRRARHAYKISLYSLYRANRVINMQTVIG